MTERDRSVADAIEASVPNSLDDIVRKNRDHFILRLMPPDILMAMESEPFPTELRIKDTMSEWSLVTLTNTDNLGRHLHLHALVGIAESTGSPRVTSQVIAVDLDRCVVRTRNSVYRIRDGILGEPDQLMLITICVVFHRWGIGRIIGAPVYYF